MVRGAAGGGRILQEQPCRKRRLGEWRRWRRDGKRVGAGAHGGVEPEGDGVVVRSTWRCGHPNRGQKDDI